MKLKRFFLAIALISTVTMVVSCKKEKPENPKESENTQVTTENMIYGKWEITTPNSKYASIEFNKDGNYIAIENTKSMKTAQAKTGEGKPDKQQHLIPLSAHEPVHKANEAIIYGTYFFQDKNTIVLSEFGTLIIISITGNEFKFSFTGIAGQATKIDLAATRAKETITATSRTNMFCRTWHIVSIAGIDVADLEMEGNSVFISRAGTYFVDYGDERKQLSQWQWYDYPGLEKETVFIFSHNNWETQGMGMITHLSNDKLIMADDSGYEYELVINDKIKTIHK